MFSNPLVRTSSKRVAFPEFRPEGAGFEVVSTSWVPESDVFWARLALRQVRTPMDRCPYQIPLRAPRLWRVGAGGLGLEVLDVSHPRLRCDDSDVEQNAEE